MRHLFDKRPRSWISSPVFRMILAACLAVFVVVGPAAAETDVHATSPNLDLTIPSGLDAQPQPVYPDGRSDDGGAPQSASQDASQDATQQDATQQDSTDDSAAQKPTRSASRPPDDGLDASLSDDPDIETLKSDDLSDSEQPVEPKTPIIVATVDKTLQEMTVFVDGVEKYRWPVSTGLPGYATPSGTFNAKSMNKIWYSKQFDNAPMPHAVFFTKQGHAIHASNETKKLGRPASHGCVRLSPKNAETFFNLVKDIGLDRTEVVLTGSTPGGDYKVAHPEQRYDPYQDYGRPAYPRYAPNRDYRRYGYNEIQPRAERRRRIFVPRDQAPRRYQRAPRRGNWFRAPGY